MRFASISRRRLRPKLTGLDTCYYHVVSRFVDRRFAFGEVEKRYFQDLMRAYEAFGCLRVVGYCLMSNHFHILVRVGARPAERLAEEALLAHVGATLGESVAEVHRREIALWRRSLADALASKARMDAKAAVAANSEDVQHNSEPALDQILPEDKEMGNAQQSRPWQELAIEAYLDGIWRRMYDVSAFMQRIKQRFTAWYNKCNERTGTLWEERFQSTVVQGGAAVTEIAAYIDLNPVRAGLVDDPKDYAWSQYGAAVAGELPERQAVAKLVALRTQLTEAEAASWDSVQGKYRVLLYRRGILRPTASGGSVGVFSREEVEQVFAEKGLLSQVKNVSYAQHRVSHFTRGVAVGSRDFVNDVWRENRQLFGPNRRSGARKIRIPAMNRVLDGSTTALNATSPPLPQPVADWGELRSLRDLTC